MNDFHHIHDRRNQLNINMIEILALSKLSEVTDITMPLNIWFLKHVIQYRFSNICNLSGAKFKH